MKLLEDDLLREQLTVASISKRTKAYLIDELLISLIVFIAFWDGLTSQTDVLATIELVNSLFGIIIVLKILYQTIFIHIY